MTCVESKLNFDAPEINKFIKLHYNIVSFSVLKNIHCVETLSYLKVAQCHVLLSKHI